MSRARAVRAGTWSAVDLVGRQGVQFILSIILARLLTPSDFGLVALLTFFTSLAMTLVQNGLSMALIQRQVTSRQEESALFWCNLVASSGFGIVMILVAPFMADFYDQPLLRELMFVAAAQIVFLALGAVQTALLTRDLRFDQLTKTGLISSALSGIAGVAAALAGWGVWALATQLLVSAAVSSASLWIVSDWRPSARMHLAEVRSFLRFGFHISLSSVLETVYTNGFLLVIGKVYGVRDLGIWNRATGLTSLPTGIIGQVIARTALPLFSQRKSEREALRRGFHTAIGISMVSSLPLMVGLCLLSDLVIVALFGPKWIEAAPLAAITALSGALLPLQILNLNLLLALGETRLYLRLEIWKKILGIIIVGAGCFFGLIAIAYAALVISIVAYIINAYPAQRLIGYGPLGQIADLWGVFLSAGLMGFCIYELKQVIDLPVWMELCTLTALGAMVYAAANVIFRVSQFKEALEIGKELSSSLLDRWERRQGVRPDRGD